MLITDEPSTSMPSTLADSPSSTNTPAPAPTDAPADTPVASSSSTAVSSTTHSEKTATKIRVKAKRLPVFLWGPLRHPAVLQSILALPAPPSLREASIHGFKRQPCNDQVVLMQWRREHEHEHANEPVPVVLGAVYRCTVEQRTRLKSHMGKAYEYHTTVIECQGQRILGKVLVYNKSQDGWQWKLLG